jgi:hypothetical protein
MVTEVKSPVTRKGSNISSNQPLSPGAATARAHRGTHQDSVPHQSPHGSASRHSHEPDPSASLQVTGPDGHMGAHQDGYMRSHHDMGEPSPPSAPPPPRRFGDVHEPTPLPPAERAED